MRYYLVDRVTDFTAGERAVGLKSITLSDPILHDHFPDHPIMPGALIVESAAQLGGFLVEMTVNADLPEGEIPQRAMLSRIRRASFFETSGPGDRLTLDARLVSTLAGAARVQVQVTADGARIAEADLTFSLRRVDSPRVHEQRRRVYAIWTRGLEPSPPIR